ncbi:MAG: LysE family transporter [Hyphomicrobiaceae bacterium]|nr:LysE family transporter [Hyphomicrobiaceae bacterium]
MSHIPNVFVIVPVGVIAGLLLALPFGPTNLLGLQRAVEGGFFGGMAAGIGIMLGDALIALFAALGVNAVTGAIREYRAAIQLLGGLGLLGAGIKLYFVPKSIATHVEVAKSSLRDHVWGIPAMFLLTITNPAAVLGLMAIYAGLSTFVRVETVLDALTMVGSIMGGSFLYWFVVSERIALVRRRLDEVQLGRINALAGLILIGFGGILIAEVVLRWLVLWGVALLF